MDGQSVQPQKGTEERLRKGKKVIIVTGARDSRHGTAYGKDTRVVRRE